MRDFHVILIWLGIIAAIAAVICYLDGCSHKSNQEEQRTSNPNIKVELLFDHDGVRVYRFYDGRYIYYTDARGKAQWDVKHSNGKGGSWTEHLEVETAQ